MTTSEIQFTWYASVTGSSTLEQGDLFDGIRVFVPALTGFPSNDGVGEGLAEEEPLADEIVFNGIIMSQSCDLAKFGDNDPVILCPRYSIRDARIGEKRLNSGSKWGQLRKGLIFGAHLINKCDIVGHEFEFQVVDLRKLFSVPLIQLKQLASAQTSRVRLLPPYREHLAQAFAAQFMRVGLPLPLPEKYPDELSTSEAADS